MAEYSSPKTVVPADSATRTRVTLALALRIQKSFSGTNQHGNAKELLTYLGAEGGAQYQYRYDETTPNSELIGIFDGHVVDCFDKDERPRVKAVLTDAKSVLATTTLAKTPKQVVDELEQFARNCGFEVLPDGTLKELNEGRQGDWRSPRNVTDFLRARSKEVGLSTSWTTWKAKGKTPDWAPKTASGALPSWRSKPLYWLAATAAARELIEARARRDAWTDADRVSDEAAAKQAAFVRYYLKVAEELIKFEVAALEKLDDAGIRKRVALRAKALDARNNLNAQTKGHASVAAGSVPKANAARQKAQAQSIAQGTNLSQFRKKKAGGLVPYNAEDGFARQRDRKACFEPADATDWLA